MQVVSYSQKGTKSDKNEDACLSLPHRGLFVVADGVGGGPSGDFASRSIVDTIYDAFRDERVTQDAILTSIRRANQVIYDAASINDRRGMASTVVVCWKSDIELCCFNVGDSRIYRVRDGAILQLTRDHTRQIQKAPNVIKQVVTNAVGIKPELKVEVSRHDWEPGDVVLLMSDGISDIVDDETIVSIISSDQYSLVDKARALVVESESRGGQDDKSIILAMIN